MPPPPWPAACAGAGPRTWRHALRAAVATIVILAVCLCVGPATAATPPLEGTFENCPLDTAMATCDARLWIMRAGGVRVVVIPAWAGSLASLARYASSAHALGMSVMWETSSPGWWQDPATATGMATYVPAFATACGCRQNGDVLAYLARWLGALPGTYGYYAADDSMLSPGDQAGLAAYVTTIKRNDPWHTVLVSASSPSQASQFNGIADETAQEIYPITNHSLVPVSANPGVWDSVAQTASGTQAAAAKLHRQSAFILQAFTWGDNIDDGMAIHACSPGDDKWSCYLSLRYPSGAEQLQLRNEVLLHAAPALILWWSFQGTYGQAGNDTYSIYPTGSDAAARWAGLVGAITARMPWPTIAAQAPAVVKRPASAKPKPKPYHRAKHHASRKRHRAALERPARPAAHR